MKNITDNDLDSSYSCNDLLVCIQETGLLITQLMTYVN